MPAVELREGTEHEVGMALVVPSRKQQAGEPGTAACNAPVVTSMGGRFLVPRIVVADMGDLEDSSASMEDSDDAKLIAKYLGAATPRTIDRLADMHTTPRAAGE